MRDTLGESLSKLKIAQKRRNRIIAVLLVLSLIVTMDVFWVLRKPGLTLAGDAACGITEHTHSEACGVQEFVCGEAEDGHTHEEACCAVTMLCGYEEHIHSIGCYSDETADVETPLDWQEMFAGYPYTGDLRKDLAGIAQTQVGYTESELNFTVDSDGNRHGYTRYGAWYGVPYSDWSAIFVSFCLHFAGADPEETPGNTGANSMATIWDTLGKYAPVGSYLPVEGDLVFFANNSVGIITTVSDASFYVIRGDMENAVSGTVLPLNDPSVSGWGVTAGTVPALEEEPAAEPSTEPLLPDAEEDSPVEPVYEEQDLLDISDGPAFFIFDGEETSPQMRSFSFMTARNITDLLEYLVAHNGNYFFTLLNMNNHELPKDANGNYIVTAETGYKLTLTVTNPDGFLPGTYQYQIPNGLMVNGGNGSFTLKDETYVGDWTVTDDGLITMVFNENMNNRSDVTISATMGIIFPEQDEPVDFDGKITVTIEKPEQEILSTKVNKWGSQGNPTTEKSDPSKIYWTIQITGNQDSNIPGSILTDQVQHYDWSYDHHYTDSDMASGISFGATMIHPETGKEEFWHTWKVSAGDPNLTWDENGWSYQMPEIITCLICGNEVTLGNEHWIYYVEYASTPVATNIAGGLPYANQVEIDNQTVEGWARFTHNDIEGAVFKNGTFIADAGGASFLWELQVTIPGREAGQRAIRHWFINDEMYLIDQNWNLVGVLNDLNLATVTANYHGKTVTVPRIQDATEDDPFVWWDSWDEDTGGDGVYNVRQICFLSRCHCTEESCALETGCWTWSVYFDDGSYRPTDYCSCWLETEDITFTFTYQTKDLSLLSTYGNTGSVLRNQVLLRTESSPEVDTTYAEIPIPSVLKKELTHDYDGYTANYEITVNESKLALINGSPLTIHDEMTQTLAYISGSLVITTEDANGNTAVLQQGTDFTVTYDGTGTKTDDNGTPVHVLDVVILHPQPVMYILDYDATLIMPESVTEGIRYSNSATITLWGEEITNTSAEKVYADINIAAMYHRVEIHKEDSQTGRSAFPACAAAIAPTPLPLTPSGTRATVCVPRSRPVFPPSQASCFRRRPTVATAPLRSPTAFRWPIGTRRS